MSLLFYFCHSEAVALFMAARLMRRGGHISQQSSSPVILEKFDLRIFSTTLRTITKGTGQGLIMEGKGVIRVSHLLILRCLRRQCFSDNIQLFV
jgi:hypothetical protein